MSQPNRDRRRFDRIPFQAKVLIRDVEGDCSRTGTILDISLKGVLVKLPQEDQPQDDAEVTLHIELGSGVDEDPVIRLQGTVVQREKDTFGVQWSEIDSESMAHLHRLLELNLNPEQVQRELSELVSTDS